jgi:hypothetical protein
MIDMVPLIIVKWLVPTIQVRYAATHGLTPCIAHVYHHNFIFSFETYLEFIPS